MGNLCWHANAALGEGVSVMTELDALRLRVRRVGLVMAGFVYYWPAKVIYHWVAKDILPGVLG